MKRIFSTTLLSGVLAAGLAFSPVSSASTSYFQQFGGIAGTRSMVNDFVNRASADPRAAYFAHTSIPALKAALTIQFLQSQGGGCKFNMNMHAIHANLGVTQAAFNALASDLTRTMDQHHIPMAAQNNLLAKLAAMEPEIVTK